MTVNDQRIEKEECRLEFMSQKKFYQSVITGITFLLLFVVGNITWALTSSARDIEQDISIKNNKEYINRIETEISLRHRETIKLLQSIRDDLRDRGNR